LYYYIFVSSRAATILGSPALWGRLVDCGRLLIGPFSAARTTVGACRYTKSTSCNALLTNPLRMPANRGIRRRLATGAQDNILPRIPASRKRGVLDVSDIWPIDNRPQATSLPHNAGDPKIFAAREQTKM
jgi:hypothetical protein